MPDFLIAALTGATGYFAISFWLDYRKQKAREREIDAFTQRLEFLNQAFYEHRKNNEQAIQNILQLIDALEELEPPNYPPPVHEEYPPIGRNPRNYR